MPQLSPEDLLSLILALISLHSFLVGIALIARPPSLMRLSGFSAVNEPFFPVQGGTFHIVMAVGYAMAAASPGYFTGLVIFSILVKFLAMTFLVAYYLLAEPRLFVLGSGLADGFMGILILYGFLSL